MSTFTPGGANDRFVDAPGAAGLNLWASLDPRFAGSGRFPNGVLRALLYCHGLIIEDPVAMAADMYLSTSPDARHLARMAVEAATSSMVEISELLDAEVVRTFSAGGDIDPIYQSLRRSVFEDQSGGLTEDEIWDEFEAGYVEGLDPRLQGLWERVRAGDPDPSRDPIEAVVADGDVDVLRIFIDVLENLKPRGVVENALSVVAHAIGEAIRLGSSVDLLCPTPLFARLASAGATGMHDLRLHELARADVPKLDGLLTNDAVAIRLRSEAFDIWRRDLSTALERAAQMRSQLGDDIDTTEVIRDSIAGARSQLFGEAQRSAAMRAGFNSWIAFVAGLIGGAVGNSTGGPLVPRSARQAPRCRRPSIRSPDAGGHRLHYCVATTSYSNRIVAGDFRPPELLGRLGKAIGYGPLYSGCRANFRPGVCHVGRLQPLRCRSRPT